MTWPPLDSADVRERREAESEQLRDELRVADPDVHQCVDGWLGEDAAGHPRPCPTCRPHLLDRACPTCGVRRSRCWEHQLELAGRCCADCRHHASPGPASRPTRIDSTGPHR